LGLDSEELRSTEPRISITPLVAIRINLGIANLHPNEEIPGSGDVFIAMGPT